MTIDEVSAVIEDLLRLRNSMHDLRAESLAKVCGQAIAALDELRRIIKDGREN